MRKKLRFRKMRAKTKFLKMFNILPKEARRELVYDFASHPMTIEVVANEIRFDTKLGKEILKRLGYEDN